MNSTGERSKALIKRKHPAYYRRLEVPHEGKMETFDTHSQITHLLPSDNLRHAMNNSDFDDLQFPVEHLATEFRAIP